MIIDNLKEFIAKFTDTHLTNDDCNEELFEPEEELGGYPEYEEEYETEEYNDDDPDMHT